MDAIKKSNASALAVVLKQINTTNLHTGERLPQSTINTNTIKATTLSRQEDEIFKHTSARIDYLRLDAHFNYNVLPQPIKDISDYYKESILNPIDGGGVLSNGDDKWSKLYNTLRTYYIYFIVKTTISGEQVVWIDLGARHGKFKLSVMPISQSEKVIKLEEL